METRIFVYGSLMNGGKFHYILTNAINGGRATLVPGKWVAPHCALMENNNFGYPGIQYSRSPAILTEGELYMVDEIIMDRIRQLEVTPSLYLETILTVRKKGMWNPRLLQARAFIINPWSFPKDSWTYTNRTKWFPKGETYDNSRVESV